jgi:type VI secretion system protein ImpB
MAKEASVAPKERVNIVYRPATGDAKEEVELPFKLLVMGDFTLAEDERTIEEREPIAVDKSNFNEVLKAQGIALNLSVPNMLTNEKDANLQVTIKPEHIRDFEPDQIVRNVPELGKLLELRDALMALKGPLGNVPAFRRKIQALVGDPETRDKGNG